jgi:16S rRNA (guanine(966)-N(2))-methyltransferase RsmD
LFKIVSYAKILKDGGIFLRIIAGYAKGRKLKSPENQDIRPTSDRVKEAIFSMIAFYIPGKIVLDLFAGTGNLGLEALSRGAKFSVFVDNNREALKLVNQNIKLLGYKDKTSVVFSDALKALDLFRKRNEKFDIVFIDPPYRQSLYGEIIQSIAENDIIDRSGILIIEHPADIKLKDEYEGLKKIKEKKYGNTSITILKREDNYENSGLSGQF